MDQFQCLFSRPLFTFERIVPAEAGKAGKVTIVGVDDGAVLDGSCGKDCICNHSTADMYFRTEFAQYFPVAIAGMKNADAWNCKPKIDGFGSCREGQWPGLEARVGYESQESVDGDGRDSDGFRR
ncbi:MAG TPA: hypothetical protein VFA99_06430 [Acidobacteriaceae bacterium]|nr:hypothetical protein [Acidobacteriaceae bacterium]